MNISTTLKWIGGVFLVGTGLALGYVYFKRQTDLLLDFCYKIRKFKIVKFTKDNWSLQAVIGITNQSDLTANVHNVELDVYINEFKVGKVVVPEGTTYKGRATNDVTVNIDVKPKDLKIPLAKIVQLIGYYVTDKSKINVRFVGHASAEAYGIPIKNYPIDMSWTLKELEEPSTAPSTCKVV